MKNYFYLVAILGLVVGCTDDLDSYSEAQQASGITFVSEDNSARETSTRGYFEEQTIGASIVYAPNWTPGEDNIQIFATNTNKNTATSWGPGIIPVVYNATTEGRLGNFMAASVDDQLTFNNTGEKAKFLAVYSPKANWTDAPMQTSANVLTGTGMLYSISTVDQTDGKGKGVFELMTRYSYAEHDPAQGNEVKLNFKHVLSGLVFETQNSDNLVDGSDFMIGPMSRLLIDLTASDNSLTDPGIPLLYNKGTTSLTLTLPTDGTGEVKAELVDLDTRQNSHAILRLNKFPGFPTSHFTDADRAYLPTLPLQMSNLAEQLYLRVGYDFESLEVVRFYPLEKKNWKPGTLYRVPALDVETLDYMVLKGFEKNRYGYDKIGVTLVLGESANLDAILNVGQQGINWAWTYNSEDHKKVVSAQYVTRILSYKSLSGTEKLKLGQFFPSVPIEQL